MARILIVDDRPINRSLLVTLLGYGGHDLVEAGDGAEALEVVKAHLPDLIITDILMPTMDGITLVHHLRANPRYKDIPVIFHTASYRLTEAKAMAEACGVRWVLAKPCDPEEILAVVNAALGLSEAPAPQPEPLDLRPLGFVGEHLGPYLRDLHELNARITSIVNSGAGLVSQSGRIIKTALELSESLGGMERVSLRLSALIEAGMDLTTERDPATLLKQFCRVAQNILCARFAVLGIPHDTDEGFSHQIIHGLPLGKMESFKTQPDFLRQIMLSRKIRQIQSPCESPLQLGLPMGHPSFQSMLAIPFASPRHVFGWLYLVDRLGEPFFSDEDKMIASTLCTQAAITYENLLLLGDLQNQIRQRILAEEAGLRLSEIVEASGDAIVSVDLNHRITNWSRGAEQTFGYAAWEVLGQPLSILAPPELQEEQSNDMGRLYRGTQLPAIETTRLRKGGIPVQVAVQTTPVRDTAHVVIGFSAIMRDITGRRAMEKALLATAIQLQNVFNNIDEVIWSYDTVAKRMLEISPSCERIYGHPPQSFFENPHLWLDGIHPEDRPAAIATFNQLLTGNAIEREERILHPDGGIRWVVVRARPRKDPTGLVVRIDGSISDITESRRLKERMAVQERLAALGTLLGSVAHDLRNPLMSITAASELLELNSPVSDYLTHHLEKTRQASKRILGLLDELLDFATPKPLCLELTPGFDLLQEAVVACDGLAKHLGIEVDLPLENNTGSLLVDRLRMHHVLRNILENAIQHSPSKGTVRVSSQTQSGAWICAIQDEGAGIAQEDLSSIFDPLYSRRVGGTGLGLAIAHRIAQLHGGQLEAENAPTGGARFTIRIPH